MVAHAFLDHFGPDFSWNQRKHSNVVLFQFMRHICSHLVGNRTDFLLMKVSEYMCDYFNQSKGPADHTPLGSATFHAIDRPDASPTLYELTRLLLKKGADPNGVYANGRIPLFGVVMRKDLHMMKILVEAGADVNLGIPVIRHTPLHRAARAGLPFVQFLLEHGADVNAKTIARNPNTSVNRTAIGT